MASNTGCSTNEIINKIKAILSCCVCVYISNGSNVLLAFPLPFDHLTFCICELSRHDSSIARVYPKSAARACSRATVLFNNKIVRSTDFLFNSWLHEIFSVTCIYLLKRYNNYGAWLNSSIGSWWPVRAYTSIINASNLKQILHWIGTLFDFYQLFRNVRPYLRSISGDLFEIHTLNWARNWDIVEKQKDRT